MEHKLQNTYHGFILTNIRKLEDTDEILYEYTHEKTGALLCWLKNTDENKTFAISFKTTPEDDTGVFHILEHSVLNGSKKYPVKEPFVELLKSSLNTFLNAMTFDDKTMYPVSSRNEKDFMNLMSVYLDAVFQPAIYQNKNIFYQEGWHYEIREKDAQPVYKGVVLNEMKGAFSSVDEALITNLNRQLFPDNCYQYVSGGAPHAITDLTYEQFIESHKRFYHPSNSRIWLDGDMDIDPVLAYINDEYLMNYDKKVVNTDIPMQKVQPASTTTVQHELSPSDNPENKTVIAQAKIISTFDNVEKNLAMAVLSNVLTGSNEAPLKKPFIDAGLVEDVEFDIYDGIQQPWGVLILRNTKEDAFDTCKALLHDTITSILNNGLDQEELLACLNQMEFRYREKQEPSGVINAQEALQSWLYGGDPALYLQLGKTYESLRQKVKEGYFEDLIKEFFLDEEHLQTLISIPNQSLGEENNEAEKAKLAKIKEEWKDDVTYYIDENLNLDAWQAEEDTKEKLATLPKLKLSDIKKTVKEDEFVVEEYRNVPILRYPTQKSNIVYMTLFFNIAGITKDLLPAFSLYTSLLTDLGTKQHSLTKLQKEIHQYLGSLTFSTVSYSEVNSPEKTLPMIAVRCSVLQQNVEKAKELILEVIQETVFSSETIKPLLKQAVQAVKQSMIASGHAYASTRANAHFTADGFFREYTSGYSLSKYLYEFDENYDARIDEFMELCQMFQDNIFASSRLTASITGEDNVAIIHDLIDALPLTDANRAQVHYPLLTDSKEAIQITGGVNYAAMATRLDAYHPQVHVLTHILTYAWLWNEVRVKGGAYGTGIGGNPNAVVNCYSYRDPDPNNALHAFEACPDFLLDSEDMDLDLEAYIIGALNNSMPLLSAAGKIATQNARYFTKITHETRQSRRTEMLNTSLDDLKNLSKIYKDALNQKVICIVGTQEEVSKLDKDYIVLK